MDCKPCRSRGSRPDWPAVSSSRSIPTLSKPLSQRRSPPILAPSSPTSAGVVQPHSLMLAAIAATWASVWVRAFFAYGISRSIELGELKLGGFDLSLTGFGDLELPDGGEGADSGDQGSLRPGRLGARAASSCRQVRATGPCGAPHHPIGLRRAGAERGAETGLRAWRTPTVERWSRPPAPASSSPTP
jgi:hypothetical protein